MFDPDPIRGGKYMLQAKRYTRTVHVASVRDLYGTVVNECANRGILVTTASYGSDAYEFAKDKPISLIDGPNLIALLKKYNRTYRIDLERRAALTDRAASPAVPSPLPA
jgi:restriction system protein